MKFRFSVIPVLLSTLLMFGCFFSVNDVPSTPAEKYLYTEGHLEDPLVKCDFGHQKIYYVLNSEDGEGGKTVLTLTNCLTADHVEKLKVLSKGPGQYSNESSAAETAQAKDQAAKIIEAFRTPLPDLSAR